MRRDEHPDTAADFTACRALLGASDHPLALLSLALPPRVRGPAEALYAFCHSLEASVGDRDPAPGAAEEARARVRRAFEGGPRALPYDRAFAVVAREHRLPASVFEAYCDALAWDAEGRRYGPDARLVDYCARVSGIPAGALCAIFGRRSEVVVERAFDLGIAARLTAIARDVGRDAKRGRVYVPIEWLEETGVDADALLERRVPAASLRPVVTRVLALADSFYLRADPGLASLPFDCRPAVRALRYLYGAIGHHVERTHIDLEEPPAPPSTLQTLRLLARALRPSRSESRPLKSQPVGEAGALVTELARS